MALAPTHTQLWLSSNHWAAQDTLAAGTDAACSLRSANGYKVPCTEANGCLGPPEMGATELISVRATSRSYTFWLLEKCFLHYH